MQNQTTTQNPMSNLISNPFFQMATNMAQGKSPIQLQQIALNICKEKGIDFDTAFANFKQQFKGHRPL